MYTIFSSNLKNMLCILLNRYKNYVKFKREKKKSKIKIKIYNKIIKAVSKFRKTEKLNKKN